jgi:glutamate synthase domain-containing protein 1
MEHRGACSADDDSGDGAGLMTQIPWELFKADLPSLNEETTGWVHMGEVQRLSFLMWGGGG